MVHFERAGRPVVFTLNNLHTFEANLVMSTLSPDDIEPCNQSIQNRSRNDMGKRICDTSEVTSLSEGTAFKRAKPNFSETSSVDEVLFNFPPRNESESVDIVRGNTQANIETQLSVPTVPKPRESTHADLENKESEGICVTFKDTEELNEVDSVPKSPTVVVRQKKARAVFKRCFEATFNPKNITGASQILAPNSDTED
ncbi:unnamed protein product [Hermetia illucens]|uniref:Uncharacterized protein n=3 Tax=Hermetia illucens TaxID=343691 RepID=A0A7R8UL01_HERIL|nr:unnamed protein product [Hermetia illucens]